MKNRLLFCRLFWGFVGIVGLTTLGGCESEEASKEHAHGLRITISQENFGSTTRTGQSPIVHQETIYMGDGVYMELVLQEDVASDSEASENTRAEAVFKDLSEGVYQILAYKDNNFVGITEGVVSVVDGKGVFNPSSDFEFDNGSYSFVCVKNVSLSDSRDAVYVDRGTASNDAALISEVVSETIDGDDLALHFTMRHKESGIRFRLNSAGSFENIAATISFTNTKADRHKYSLPSGAQDASATTTSDVDDINLEDLGGATVLTPYLYFLPGTTVEDLKITFTDGEVWGKSIAGKSLTLNNNKQLDCNTLYTATITFHDGVPAFDGVIAVGGDGRLTLSGDSDPKARTVYFKYGGVVALSSSYGATSQNWGAGEVAFNPTEKNNDYYNPWNNILYQTTDVAHTADGVKNGLGDPCRLVGLTMDQIKSGDIDNCTWRLPTYDEMNGRTSLTGMNDWDVTAEGYKSKKVRMTINGASLDMVFPAFGQRYYNNGTSQTWGTDGWYWTKSATSDGKGYCFKFTPYEYFQGEEPAFGLSVRCVPQEPHPGTGGAGGTVPAINGIIAIGTNGRLTLTGEEDANARTVFFKYGSVIGITTGQTGISWNNQSDRKALVAFNPTNNSYYDKPWSDIVCAKQNVDVSFQTKENVSMGLGDPCRLVGLSLDDIKNGKVDNGVWRLPTGAEIANSTCSTGSGWDQYKEFNGKWVTLKDFDTAPVFYPAAGYVFSDGGGFTPKGTSFYLSSTYGGGDNCSHIKVSDSGLTVANTDSGHGFVVRCVLK